MPLQAQSSVAAEAEAEWRAQIAEEGLRQVQGELVKKEAHLRAAIMQATGPPPHPPTKRPEWNGPSMRQDLILVFILLL